MNDFENIKKVCFTGYRPEKFPFKLNNDNVDFLTLKSRIIKTLTSLIEDDCRIFYCGMAQGFDIICAECVLFLKQKFKDIKLICAIPFENQERSFTFSWRNRYYDVLEVADEVIYISKEYHSWCYQERNKFMVDNSDFVVCWYDGKSGGTKNTLKYALKKKCYIINLNIDYLDEFTDLQTSINLI